MAASLIPSPDGMRMPPALPSSAMTTYQILAPLATHWRAASCEEVGCLAHHHGWVTVVDEATELGQRQAHHIRSVSRRPYTQERREDGRTSFRFGAGLECFAEHRIRIERPEHFLRRAGDWRGTTGRPYLHTSADSWVDDMQTNQDRLARIIKRG